MQAAVHNAKGIKVMIDYHFESPSDFDDYRLSNSSASSTAELVYEFYETLKEIVSNKDIAVRIYTGIMTDTGSLDLTRTTARVHRIVADLVDQGINVGRIQSIYDSFDLEQTSAPWLSF